MSAIRRFSFNVNIIHNYVQMKINKPFCVNVQLILLDKNDMYVDWVISGVILSFSAYIYELHERSRI